MADRARGTGTLGQATAGTIASDWSQTFIPVLGYADDAIPFAEPELSAMVLPDPHPLDEPEGRREPGDRLTHIGIDQDVHSHVDHSGHGRNPPRWDAQPATPAVSDVIQAIGL